MGCTESTETRTPSTPKELANNLAIEKEIENSLIKDRAIKKLLLLGAGESGKSTIFKQVKCLFVEQFNNADRTNYLTLIRQNIISNTIIFLDIIRENPQDYQIIIPEEEFNEIKEHFDKLSLDPAWISSKEYLQDEKGLVNTGKMVLKIWNDPAVQKIWLDRAKFQIEDSCIYFFPIAEKFLGNTDYLPSDQDIFRLRVRTTGILEMSFKFNDVPFLMVDVGGQRNERKKWIHCFQDVNAVIFVAAASEYDQVLYEDSTVSRMTETLNLFHDTINNKFFANMTVILFLNKRDLLEEKLKTVPLSKAFPEIDGLPESNTYEAAVKFLIRKFLSTNEKRGKREIFTHVTCATDTDCVNRVFHSVKESVVMNVLSHSGLLE